VQPRAQRSVAEGPGYHRGGESAMMSSAECQTYAQNVTSGMTITRLWGYVNESASL
jgi:hypothetical protein